MSTINTKKNQLENKFSILLLRLNGTFLAHFPCPAQLGPHCARGGCTQTKLQTRDLCALLTLYQRMSHFMWQAKSKRASVCVPCVCPACVCECVCAICSLFTRCLSNCLALSIDSCLAIAVTYPRAYTQLILRIRAARKQFTFQRPVYPPTR